MATEYLILETKDGSHALAEMINARLDQGWQLRGDFKYNSTWGYSQAMTREVEVKSKSTRKIDLEEILYEQEQNGDSL